MMTPANVSLPVEIRERLQGTLDRFEDAWRRDQRPRLDDYLDSAIAERHALLIALCGIDLNYRLQAIEPARAEDYLSRYPELGDDPAATLDLIVAEYQLCQRYGLSRTLEDYLSRFPDRAAALEQRLRHISSTAGDGGSRKSNPGASGQPTVPDSPPTHHPANRGSPTMQADERVGRPNDAGQNEEANPPDLPPGYEYLGKLGKGGMGIVYKARAVKLNRPVALKMIRWESGGDSVKRQRFQAEAEAVARLRHSNIVQIYEVGDHHGDPFISLEFVEGGTLRARLADKEMPAKQAALLIEKLAGAMQTVHQAGFVHRDLKPDNVLLTAAGEPKITDFGVAKRLSVDGMTDPFADNPRPSLEGTSDDLSNASCMTATVAVMGTLSYTSPEQAAGRAREADARADVYSLGVILYECLTGRPPFLAESREALRIQVISHQPVPVRELQPKIPRDLEAICLKCLEKEPQKRYASAAALAEELSAFLAGQPVKARPVGPVERSWKWACRKPAQAALLGMTLLTLVSVAVGATLFAWQAEQGRMKANLHVQTEKRLRQEADEHREDAEKQKQRAEEKEKDARQQQEEAEKRKKEAERERTEAHRQKEQAERLLYDNQIAQAQREWQDGWPQRARALLDVCPLNARGWEHAYLRGIYDAKQTLYNCCCAIFSPNGKQLATVIGERHEPGEIKVWDVATDQELYTIEGQTVGTGSVAFSPDGTRLASASGDPHKLGEVKVWDAATGQELRTLKGHTGIVICVAFSPDGNRLVSVSGDGGESGDVKVWDAANGTEILSLRGPNGEPTSLAFSPDGRLVSASWQGWSADPITPPNSPKTGLRPSLIPGPSPAPEMEHRLKVWDTSTGKELLTLKRRDVWKDGCFIVSPDSKLMASNWEECLETGKGKVRIKTNDAKPPLTGRDTDNREVKVWDATTGQQIYAVIGVSGSSCLAFSPDGKRLAGVSGGIGESNEVKVWDAATGHELHTLKGCIGSVTCVAYSPDGKRLASADYWGNLKVWDAATGSERYTHSSNTFHSTQDVRIAFSPDGTRLARTSGDYGKPEEMKVLDAAYGTELLHFKGNTGVITSMVFSPDGTRLVACSQCYGETNVWDTMTSQKKDSDYIIIQKDYGYKMLHPGRISALTFSPDGTLLASGTEWNGKGPVKVWELGTGWCALSLVGNAGMLFDKHLNRILNRLANRSRDYMIEYPTDVRIWEASTRRELLRFDAHNGMVTSLAFSPDGKRLASASLLDGKPREVEVWDARTSRKLLSFNAHSGTVGGMVTSLAFSPDGKRLASASVLFGNAGEVKVWDVSTGRRLLTLLGHTSRVDGLTFSPDGTRLAGVSAYIGSSSREVKVWDATTGDEIHTLQGHTGLVASVAFSPDGKRLASTSGEDGKLGEVKVWDAATGDELYTLKGHTSTVTSVAFSPDGKRLASGSEDCVKVWDLATGQELLTFKEQAGVKIHSIASLIFSPDGKRLTSAADDLSMKVWKVATGQEIVNLKGALRPVISVAFSSDGKRIITREKLDRAGPFRTVNSCIIPANVRAWDAVTGSEIRPCTDPAPPFGQRRAISPDGRKQVDIEGGVVVIRRDAPFTLPPEERRRVEEGRTRSWHEQEARRAEQEEKWFAAAFHLDWLIRGTPEDSDLCVRRDMVHLEMDLSEKLAADSAETPQRQSDHNTAVLMGRAFACLAHQDLPSYRRTCAALQEAVSQINDPSWSLLLAQTCTLAPDGVADWTFLLRRTKQLASVGIYREATLCRGRVLLRTGRYTEAINELRRALELRPKGAAVHEELLLALAYHHLGQEVEASRWLDKATAWLDNKPDPAPDANSKTAAAGVTIADGPATWRWADKFALRLLQREARSLIQPQPRRIATSPSAH